MKAFLSYRRDDTQFISTAICEKLESEDALGRNSVFIDIDGIPPGVDFRDVIRDTILKCEFFLVIIGRNWVHVKDEYGQPRLMNPGDFVRLEIESALERNIPITPVLVDGASMPRAEHLPESIHRLLYLNAAIIRHGRDFQPDIERLVHGLFLAKRMLERQGVCPHCKSTFKFPSESVGKKSPCPICKIELILPQSDGAVAEYLIKPVVTVVPAIRVAKRDEEPASDGEPERTPWSSPSGSRTSGEKPTPPAPRRWRGLKMLLGVLPLSGIFALLGWGLWSLSSNSPAKDKEFASEQSDFENLPAGKKPPSLDCTVPNGTDAKTVRESQIAWAKYLKEPNYEKTMHLDAEKKSPVEMVLIPPGKYLRSSAAGIDTDDERPQAVVTLDQPLWVGNSEITQIQYSSVMMNNPSRFNDGGYRMFCPVENVSFDDCISFCTKASTNGGCKFRLLTEVEWEYACRAGTQTKYYNGDSVGRLEDIAVYGKQQSAKFGTEMVRRKLPNAFGLYDMSGNVNEWCSDKAVDESMHDPGLRRVIRGGSWFDFPFACASAYKNSHKEDSRSNSTGFRIAVSWSSN